MDIMTRDHPSWIDFTEDLADALSVNQCNEQHDNAIRILAKMGANVDQSLDHFHTMGICCDCEILLNLL